MMGYTGEYKMSVMVLSVEANWTLTNTELSIPMIKMAYEETIDGMKAEMKEYIEYVNILSDENKKL